ncbi:MAG: RadC family protein [Clostridia bacterium]|nr:RadC family protein [Clostridia bacterium]
MKTEIKKQSASKKADVHNGHRKRMLERYRKTGVDGFAMHELLEMLLFYVIPRKNTNDIAHLLLSQFGSLKSVLNAPLNKLMKTEGIGKVSATFIRLVSDVSAAAERHRYGVISLDSQFRQMNYVYNWFKGKQASTVCLVMLDDKRNLIDTAVLSAGRTQRAVDYCKMCVDLCKQSEASYAILCHNHHSNCRRPSLDDLKLTSDIRISLSAEGVYLLEHYIVTEDDCIPMQSSTDFS